MTLNDFARRLQGTYWSEDFVELDNENNEIPSRRNRDKITNTHGRCLLDLCKTPEMSIVNGKIGSEKG